MRELRCYWVRHRAHPVCVACILGSYYNNRGLAYYRLDKQEQALNDFKEALDIDPSDPNFYFNRGNAKRAIKVSDC